MFRLLRRHKKWAFVAADALLTVGSIVFAFWLRFDGTIPDEYSRELLVFGAMLAGLNTFFIAREQLHAFTWSFVGLQDLTRLVRALTYASGVFALLLFLDFGTTNFFSGFPRSVIFISYFLNLILIGGLRISKRLWNEIMQQQPVAGGIPTLVIGAGPEGERIVRDLRSQSVRHYDIVGLVDEDLGKKNTLIHGVPVLGGVLNLPKYIEEYKIGEIVIALPSADSEKIKQAVRAAREAGIASVKIIPPFSDIIQKKITFEALRDITIEDLLGRETAKIETGAINAFVKGKTILVTGAAGSIGSEIARQLSQFSPANLLLLDFNESGIYDLAHELAMSFPDQKTTPIISNITNREKVNSLFRRFSPELVFHAAAYKHVPLMEQYPEEAVEVNVLGSRILGEAAKANGAKAFVFISTDKAVKPSSVMGKTKRAAEIVMSGLNSEGGTKFVAVRFGNVLASRGSVIPLFKEQIKRRTAVTVTHPDMTRYFMTIPEAALLVLEAGAIGGGGEIFLLDMGKPVKILDLAHEIIRLSGLEPDKDIPIVFTGIRPGEKIFEELLTAEEGSVATKYEKIFISHSSRPQAKDAINEKLRLLELSLLSGSEKVKQALDTFIETPGEKSA